MRRVAIMVAPFVLAGCVALPPQLALVTQAADGVSYVLTGKSGTDQLMSAALRKDCVMIRVVQGEAICKARPEDTEQGQAAIQVQGGEPGAAFDRPAGGDQMLAIASAPPPDTAAPVPTRIASAEATPVRLLPDAGAPAREVLENPRGRTQERPAPSPESSQPVTDAAPAVRPASSALERAEPAKGEEDYYVVVGDYRSFDRALDRAGRQTAGVATIVTRSGKGAKTHRVMIGPYALAEARAARKAVPRTASRTAWLVRACPRGADGGPARDCMDLEKTWR